MIPAAPGIVKRTGVRNDRRFISLEVKLDQDELTLDRIQWSKSLSGYELEFKGALYQFREQVPVDSAEAERVQQLEQVAYPQGRTISWYAKFVPLQVNLALERAGGDWNNIPSVQPVPRDQGWADWAREVRRHTEYQAWSTGLGAHRVGKGKGKKRPVNSAYASGVCCLLYTSPSPRDS